MVTKSFSYLVTCKAACFADEEAILTCREVTPMASGNLLEPKDFTFYLLGDVFSAAFASVLPQLPLSYSVFPSLIFCLGICQVS